jgi:hypothetical protein
MRVTGRAFIEQSHCSLVPSCSIGQVSFRRRLHHQILLEIVPNDYTGVWRNDVDGALLTLSLKTPTKTIQYGENKADIDALDFDATNKVLTLTLANGEPEEVIAIHQVYEVGNPFILKIIWSNRGSFRSKVFTSTMGA